MAPLDLSQVGFTNKVYSTEEEEVIRQALITAKQSPGERNEEIARYEKALAPHKKLNEDVLIHIFTFACEEFDATRSELRRHPLMIVSYVCSVWRHITLNTSHLWAGVRLGAMFPVYRGYSDFCLDVPEFRWIKFFLDRGGSLPRNRLAIYYGNAPGRLGMVQHLVAPYPFQDLILKLKCDELELIKDIPTERMVHLRRLTLSCLSVPHAMVVPLPLPAQMPKLENLELCGCFKGNLENLISAVPWHNLTHLNLRFPVPSNTCFHVILRQGVSLVECTIRPGADPAFSSAHIIEPLILPVMKRLILCCESEVEVRMFDRAVLTPAVSGADIRSIGLFPTRGLGD